MTTPVLEVRDLEVALDNRQGRHKANDGGSLSNGPRENVGDGGDAGASSLRSPVTEMRSAATPSAAKRSASASLRAPTAVSRPKVPRRSGERRR